MWRPKYIVVDDGTNIYPLIGPEFMDHSDLVGEIPFKNIISAGFFQIYEDKVTCFGRSVTLNLESRPEVDANLLTRILGLNREGN